MDTTRAPVPTRACGRRQAGGAYLTVPTGPGGHDIECFLTDGPILLDNPEALGLSPIGVKLVEDQLGVVHVFDWIGSESYPNVADFLEEARRFGISRRISSRAEFARLTPKSRLILIHARAIVADPAPYLADDQPGHYPCPQQIARAHCGRAIGLSHQPGEWCGRFWWQDVRGGHPIDQSDQRAVTRTVGDTTYIARDRPLDCAPNYQVGIIGRFPLGAIQVIADPAGGTHEETYAAARRAKLPVEVVPE